MNTVAIIQARCGSTRFPNKVFTNLCGHPLIWHVVNRLKFASEVNEIVIATTTKPIDDKLQEWARNNGIKVYRGSENDVLNRFYEAAKFSEADIIVRITADDPFKEPHLIDVAVKCLKENGADFVCNNYPPSFPEGTDVEVFTFQALSEEEKQSTSEYEREHVTQYFYHNQDSFNMKNLRNDKDLSFLRWTIDTETDLEMVTTIYNNLYKDDKHIFHMEDILSFLEANPMVAEINSRVARSAMYRK